MCGRGVERSTLSTACPSRCILPVSVPGVTDLSRRLPQDIYELKDQIQDVEGKYMQGLKELKVLVCEH